MYFTDQNIMQRWEGPRGTKFWRSWNAEMKYTNEWSSKNRLKKWDHLSNLSCLLPELFSLKCQKWLIFCSFCWCQQKLSHSLDKLFTCLFNISFNSLRSCYRLLDSELPFERHQPLNIQNFIILLLTQQFFDIFTLNISQTVTPKPMNHTIFWKNSKRSFRCTF